MRGCVVPSAALALLLVAGLASAAPIKLRVGFYNTSTPMSAFEGAVLDGVCTNLGVNCVITQLNLENDTVADLVNGTEDMTMGQFTVSPDRAQLVDFVQPYYYSAALGIYSTPQAGPTLAEPPTARWEGLRGKPVCIVAGHYFQQQLAQQYGINFVVVPTFSQLEPAVTSGQCVAAVADTNGAGPPGLEFQGQFPPQNEQPYGIAVSKNNTLLSRQITDALNTLLRDGNATADEREFLAPVGVPPNPFLQRQVAAVPPLPTSPGAKPPPTAPVPEPVPPPAPAPAPGAPVATGGVAPSAPVAAMGPAPVPVPAGPAPAPPMEAPTATGGVAPEAPAPAVG